jgi:uncharacterized membrane protein
VEIGRLFGFLHPALVHFPLVLLLVSFGLEAAGYLSRDRRCTWAAQVTLIIGAVATLFAFVCGNFAEIWAARDGIPQAPMELHELYATITSWLFVFLAAARLLLRTSASRKFMPAYLACMAGACVLLVITGHKGAMLVYQHGAGVQVGAATTLPTHEDLAVLRQKQDPVALWYSNSMHHVFGWMVLAFSGLLLADMLSPALGSRLRKVAPLLLLAGGVFLMIRSDTDSWPLSNQRPITDKEVLMHKAYALLMLGFGVQGLRTRKRRTPATFPAADSAPVSASGGQEAAAAEAASGGRTRSVMADGGAAGGSQGRMMAVFSLIGGALLFTHVHSNAPYANVAVGVYLHHTVMGFVALSIGAVKLAGDLLPGGSGRLLVRSLAWAYPCLMLAESIFLLNYNEGLPWFLGYRNLSLAAPHGGLIAPLGDRRAELVYDRDRSRLDVYVFHQADNRPDPVAATEMEVVTRIATESTAVPLTVCAEPEGSYHFAGIATFLRGEPAFQAMALVKQPGSGGDRTLAADFEPWTDGRLAAQQHTQAAFVCPMHPAVGSGAPGVCAVCGMTLVPNKAARPWNRLHDDAYHMDLSMSAPEPAPERLDRMFASAGRVRPPDASQFAQRNGGRFSGSRDVSSGSGAPPGGAMAERLVPVLQPAARQRVRLTLTPRRADGSVVAALQVVHTKKLHLIVVSKDLSFFDHVHPAQQRDGSLTLDYAFPAPGEYVLFADCTPAGDRNQVFATPVTVAGIRTEARPLTPTPAQAKVFGRYRVRLDLSPDPAAVRDETQLTFTVEQDGKPATDLEPYLGAGGHCVAIGEGADSYVHSHPVEMAAAGARFGPSVTFHTVFPRAGLYKVWGQFSHHGRPLIADFVVRVP